MPDADRANRKTLAIWLFICAFMVFAMTVIGAITRLTESGLSIAEWKPFIGAIPPLNDTEWNRVFELYKQTPEFQKKNFWMGIGDFKAIFFWEWLHRLWGRLIGLAFALPLIAFWVRGMIPYGYKLKLIGLLALGGAQGAMGWYMVKSGLVDIPDVSPYRLAAHLGLALLIFSLLIWVALSLIRTPGYTDKKIHIHVWVCLAFVALTIFWGALTAGFNAGYVYNNDFPFVNGKIVPPDFWASCDPVFNFISNITAIQFMHRWLAMGSVFIVCTLWVHATIRKKSFVAIHALAAMIFVQLALGILTLLTVVQIQLAATHQAGAIIVIFLLIKCLFETTTPRRRATDNT
ncbi:MAG: COX15/CtaA family protein [Alphaproteobacteria bacterium]|nr:COX15/CtaA family protein [Alphaproteobacteria bacterium]